MAERDPDAELNLVEVDVAAVVDLCCRFVPGMVGRGRGAVLNVALGRRVRPAARAGHLWRSEGVRAFLHAGHGRGVARHRRLGRVALPRHPVHTGFGEAAGISKEEAEAALPSFLWVTGDEVAKAAVDAAAGKAVIVPGAFNRVSTALYHLAPRRLLLPLLARNHPGLKAN